MASILSELEMREAVAVWGRTRWPGSRLLHEVDLGDRRIDLVFVGDKDLVGIEIKSGVDRLDRLSGQIKEFSRYLPEVWVAIAPRWRDHPQLIHAPMNIVVVADAVGGVIIQQPAPGHKPRRDELVCSRLIEVLWYAEAGRIAQRTGCFPGPIHKQVRSAHLKKLIARLLTGNEILTEICRELRERPAFGHRSDAPVRAGMPEAATVGP